jgi:hypothetical protein
MPIVLDGTTGIQFPDSSLQAAAASPYVLKNRIINGDMRIDQRNAGASVTPADGAYTLDRWQAGLTQASKFSVQRSTVAPTGFTNSLLVTSLSAYSVLTGDLFRVSHYIEGFNTSDLGWGAAGAQTVTLSFWVRSSLTGTFSGSLMNSAINRAYPFTYSISAANTWEQKSVTIAGDTSGTWLTDNGIGIRVGFSLGAGATFSGTAGAWAASTLTAATGATSVVGTSGATLYITGVQLEQNTSATPFERRLYNQELANCQRYCPVLNAPAAANKNLCLGMAYNTTVGIFQWQFPVQARTAPTGISVTGTYTFYQGETAKSTLTPTFNTGTVEYGSLNFSTTGLTAASCLLLTNDSNTSKIVFNGCEL